MRCLYAPLFAALVFCGSSQPVMACRCAPPPPPKKALESATAVFLGTVTNIDRASGGSLQVTFKVATNFKGVKTEHVVVRTSASSASCGYGFTEGEVYLVYCTGEADKLSTNLCSRTREASRAAEDLKELGAGEAIKE
jgi:hypothetical protein